MLDENIIEEIMRPGAVSVVAGRPAMGKTAFAVDFAKIIIEKGKRVVYYSFDLNDDEIEKRFDSNSLGSGLLRIINCRHTSIESRIKYEEEVDLIIIDYLQLCNEGKGDSFLGRIKKMAKKNGCAILFLSQVSRGVEARRNPIPQLTDLPESYIINDADNILFLYRPAYYDYNKSRDDGYVIVAKHSPYELKTGWNTKEVSWAL